jgi:predicted unusual protein kinase regulating ubiquinone biosynthesis (AarF/ABC1/UbiB family)
LNELAHGDLNSLCQNTEYLKNNELMLNLAAQAMISIMTFHHLGYIHSDCHWGNFLYHMTEDTSGYYHYNINKKNYYLKNCGITMMIYDFGFAKKYNEKTSMLKYKLVDDYKRILPAFQNKTDKGWNKHSKLPDPIVSQYIRTLYTDIRNSPVYEATYKDIMYNIILNKLLTMPINNIFVETLPAGEKIINSTAFVIDDKLTGLV